jgi:hypothetical protein
MDAQDGGQSTYNGSIAVTQLDRSLVQSALPGDLRLAQRLDGGNTHPVIHLVGHQRNLKYLSNGIPIDSPIPDYQEMILLIPFVIRGSGSKWHNFVVRMYLNSAVPIILGDLVYAYAKLPGQLAESGARDDLTTAITDLSVTFLLVFKDDVRVTGPWSTSDTAGLALPPWKDLQEILKMPLLGADVAQNTIVRTVCSYWEWDLTSAEVAPVTSRHQYLQACAEGMSGWVKLGQLSSDPKGSFAIRGLRWRMATAPADCYF